MIDYADLCRAIDDWKAGHAPRAVSSPPSRPPPPLRAAAVATETVVEGFEAVEEPIEEPVEEALEAGEAAPEQAPEDRTMIYALPDEIDEGAEV